MLAHPSSADASNAKGLLPLAFLEGMAVMLLELSCGHVMSMHCGGNLRTWATVIGLTMAGLALGYLRGASRRSPDSPRHILQTLAWGTALPAVFLFLWANWTLLPQAPPVLRAFLGAAIVILPAMAALGQSMPRLVALAGTDATRPGRLFATSTLGAVLAAYLGGFILLPLLGSTQSLLLLGTLLPVAAALLPPTRIARAALAIPCLLCLVLPSTTPRPLMDAEGLLGRVTVVEDTATRTLLLNGLPQTVIQRDGRCSRLRYPHQVEVLASAYPAGSRSLVLGVGGGTIVNALLALGHDVQACELNPLVAQAAETHFGLPHGITQVDDGRHFLRRAIGPFHLIVVDCFFGDSPPAHMLSREALRDMESRLHADGMLILYFPSSQSTHDPSPAMMRATMAEAGLQVAVIANEGRAAGQLLIGTRRPFTYSAYPPFHLSACAESAGLSLRMPFRNYPHAASEAAPFTDDRPLLDWLTRPARVQRRHP